MSAFTFLDGAFLAATQVSGEQTVDVAITGMPMQMAAVVTQPATVDVAIVGSPMTMAAVLSSGAPPSGDADADAYIALLGGTYSGAEEDAIDAFVVALKGRTLSDGGSQWASLTEFWICALDNSTDALLGLKGNFALQTQNAPTFTAREGFKLNGSTQSLFSAINPSVRSSVERGVAGAYTRLGSTNECVIFSADEGQGSYLEHYGDGFGLYGSLLFAGLYREPTGTYNGSATVTLNATDIVLCLNQTAFSEESGGFAPPDEPDVRWGRYDSETVSSASDDQFAACWVGFEGKGWTEAETQAFHADVETLLDAFGAGVMESPATVDVAIVGSPMAMAAVLSGPATVDVAITGQPMTMAAVVMSAATDPYFANVALLLHMDGTNGSTTFTDSSSNAFTITANGDAQITTTDPKFGTGAGLFDGTGDYLEFTGPTGVTGDFTIEVFTKANSVGDENSIFCISNDSTINIFLSGRSNGYRFFVRNDAGTTIVDITGGTVSTSAYQYVAARVVGTTATIWVNGVQVASGTLSGTRTQTYSIYKIGRLITTVPREWNGRLDELRFTTGVARDVSVVPTAPFPNS